MDIGSYLLQKISLEIQRGNAASIMGAFGAGVDMGGNIVIIILESAIYNVRIVK